MNLLLKATELGLSTLVMGIRDNEKIKEVLNIPETEAVVSVIGVGYSNAEPAMPKRKANEDIAKIFKFNIAKRKVKTCTAVAVQVFLLWFYSCFTVLNKFNCCAVSKHFSSLLHNRS